ncbi:DoxX family protein [Bacillus vallismortis]|uniref:DoxX family protein n=1 Tax=Bacillus vallismortis TaxID=72361 RepID=UPI002090400A|nr:DoxX family protein [Bacillus vallismortis]MCO4851845.1 DoxX family protein [Bacillus vallismortis]
MISMIMKASLAVFMLAGGVIKVLRVPFQVEHWRHYQYPLWFLTVIGMLEITGSLAMAAGIWNRHAAFGAGALFIFLMAGAVHAHMIRARQSVLMTIPAIICLIVSVMIVMRELMM